jgi:hypothetical protein
VPSDGQSRIKTGRTASASGGNGDGRAQHAAWALDQSPPFPPATEGPSAAWAPDIAFNFPPVTAQIVMPSGPGRPRAASMTGHAATRAIPTWIRPERFQPIRAPSSSRLVWTSAAARFARWSGSFGQESKANRHYRQGGATRDDSGRQEQSERRQSPPKYDPSCIDSIRSDGDPHRQSPPFFIQRWCGES